jgi:hypothetical protein
LSLFTLQSTVDGLARQQDQPRGLGDTHSLREQIKGLDAPNKASVVGVLKSLGQLRLILDIESPCNSSTIRSHAPTTELL